jgi:hypothetical protein
MILFTLYVYFLSHSVWERDNAYIECIGYLLDVISTPFSLVSIALPSIAFLGGSLSGVFFMLSANAGAKLLLSEASLVAAPFLAQISYGGWAFPLFFHTYRFQSLMVVPWEPVTTCGSVVVVNTKQAVIMSSQCTNMRLATKKKMCQTLQA